MLSIKQSFSNFFTVVKESIVCFWYNPTIIATAIIFNLLLRIFFERTVFGCEDIAAAPHAGTNWFSMLNMVLYSMFFLYFVVILSNLIVHIFRKQSATVWGSLKTSLSLIAHKVGIIFLLFAAMFFPTLLLLDKFVRASVLSSFLLLGIMFLLVLFWLTYSDQVAIDSNITLTQILSKLWKYIKRNWLLLLLCVLFTYAIEALIAKVIITSYIFGFKSLTTASCKWTLRAAFHLFDPLILIPIKLAFLLVLPSRLYLQLRQENK